MEDIKDVIIIGGGPCGLAVGIEARKNNLSHAILEKGSITESIRHFPPNMVYYSTADMISIGDIPFPTVGKRPTREESIEYYRRITDYYNLDLRVYTKVTSIEKKDDVFYVETESGEVFKGCNVVMAIGYYDHPNLLNIPGEDLPHVTHYFDEAFKYSKTKVVVVGGSNSAADTALDIYRHGGEVTLVHRREQLADTIKYWIKPDIENRIKEGSITAHFNSEIKEITREDVLIQNNKDGNSFREKADFVLMMTGYRPDVTLLEDAGIELDPATLKPQYNPETYETNLPGMYVAGSIIAGKETKRIFIENGREHAKYIIGDIKKKQPAFSK